ncbi:MAG TPA: hypothetical protein PKY30_03430, partial [Myxococcota bacterium]|nr:hypothetical protein [Myxococcota bacterium]
MDLAALAHRLNLYYPTYLQQMLDQWEQRSSGPFPPKNAAEMLAKILMDADRVNNKIQSLPPLVGEVLHRIYVEHPAALSSLRLTMVKYGHPEPLVTEAICALTNLGIFVPAEGQKYMIEPDDLFASGPRVTLPPSLTGPFVLPAAPVEHLPKVEPTDFGAISLGDPSRFANALADLLALSQRRRLSLTQKGWLNATQQATISKAIPTSPLEPGTLVHLALATGLLSAGEDLRPGPKAELLVAPLETLLHHCFWNVLPHFSTEPVPDGLAQSSFLLHDLCASQLRRLEAGHWVAVDDWIHRMIELHPNIGIAGLGGRRWDSLPNLRGQRHDLVAFLLRLCLPLGLIDMAGPLVLPEAGLSGGYVAFTALRMRPQPWNPAPTAMAFRLTPIGKAALLGTSAPEEKRAAEQVHVTPDFHVVVPARADPALLLLLGRAALSLPVMAGDPVRQFRLERERWVQSLQSGLNAEEFLTKLEKATGRPLPGNVRSSLEDWGRSFGALRLLLGQDFHRFSTTEERDQWVKGDPARSAVGERDGLAPTEPPTRPGRGRPRAEILDYRLRLPPCVILDEEGYATPTDNADLLAVTELSQIGTPTGRIWRLTRESVTASKWTSKRMREWLGSRLVHSPEGMWTRVLAWSGGVGPVALGSVELLQVDDTQTLLMLYTLPELMEHVVGVFPPSLLVLRPHSRPVVEKRLEELGIRFDTGLS